MKLLLTLVLLTTAFVSQRAAAQTQDSLPDSTTYRVDSVYPAGFYGIAYLNGGFEPSIGTTGSGFEVMGFGIGGQYRAGRYIAGLALSVERGNLLTRFADTVDERDVPFSAFGLNLSQRILIAEGGWTFFFDAGYALTRTRDSSVLLTSIPLCIGVGFQTEQFIFDIGQRQQYFRFSDSRVSGRFERRAMFFARVSMRLHR